MTKEEIREVLEKHQHWLNEDCDGWEDMKADLYEANLRGINLHGADLRGANLYGANLCRANLCRANLCGTDLRGASLHRANLCGANLWRADLRGASLYRADLYEANLYAANLHGATNVPFIPLACPDTGAFVGWKKASGRIVCLEIPADAKRLSATGRKCRCDKAKVLSITELNGEPCDLDAVNSNHDSAFVYKVGKIVFVENFDENRWNECSTGIHFFINRQEAVEY